MTSKSKSSTSSSSSKIHSISKTTVEKQKIIVHPQSPIHNPTDKVLCWAHTREKGHRCKNFVKSREGEPIPIPYCEVHMKSGDGALKVVLHPFAGKCLVARYDLPKKYRLAFWGVRGRCKPSTNEDRAISFYPPNKITGRNKEKDGTRKVNNYNGVLNPGDTGDLIQYATCPGPNERQNMRSTFQYWGVRNGKQGGLEFITLEDIPKGTQLTHWYGPNWWSARNLKRRDFVECSQENEGDGLLK